MSLAHKSLQLCPHCQSMQEVNYYQSVNVTIDPSLKQKVLSRTLNTNMCTTCNREINIVSGFLYHDMANRIMLELALGENDIDEGKEAIIKDLINKGYIYRKVHEYGRLIEQIKIFDQKLNDKIIANVSARMKAMLESLKASREASTKPEFTVIFDKLEKNWFKKEIAFHCYTHPSQVMRVMYDIKRLSLDEKRDLYNMDLLRKQAAIS